jgi:hypothetical protein
MATTTKLKNSRPSVTTIVAQCDICDGKSAGFLPRAFSLTKLRSLGIGFWLARVPVERK